MSVARRPWITPSGETKTAWVARWYDAEGKYRQKQFERKRDAVAHEHQVRAELAEGIHVPDSKSVTFRIVSALWLARKRINGNAESALVVLETIPRLHLNSLTIPQDYPNGWLGEFGDFKLSHLTSPICDALWLRLRETKSANMAKTAFRTFKSILKEARRRGLMKHNPAEPVNYGWDR